MISNVTKTQYSSNKTFCFILTMVTFKFVLYAFLFVLTFGGSNTTSTSALDTTNIPQTNFGVENDESSSPNTTISSPKITVIVSHVNLNKNDSVHTLSIMEMTNIIIIILLTMICLSCIMLTCTIQRKAKSVIKDGLFHFMNNLHQHHQANSYVHPK